MTSRWKELGLALRLRPAVLKTIETQQTDLNSRMIDILTEWLQQNYNTDCFGLPSWKLLVDAVAHCSGGNNPALARQIATKRNGKCNIVLCIYSIHNTYDPDVSRCSSTCIKLV